MPSSRFRITAPVRIRKQRHCPIVCFVQRSSGKVRSNRQISSRCSPVFPIHNHRYNWPATNRTRVQGCTVRRPPPMRPPMRLFTRDNKIGATQTDPCHHVAVPPTPVKRDRCRPATTEIKPIVGNRYASRLNTVVQLRSRIHPTRFFPMLSRVMDIGDNPHRKRSIPTTEATNPGIDIWFSPTRNTNRHSQVRQLAVAREVTFRMVRLCNVVT